MKYLKIVLILLLFTPFLANAQDEVIVVKETSNNTYLPEAGDISIGADALPYLRFLGNMFNNTVDNDLNLGDNTLYFKYFLTDNSAVRVLFSTGNTTSKIRRYVADDNLRLDPLTPNAWAEDMRVKKSNNTYLNVGYQIYRTHNRLAGYYGAQVGYGFSKYSSEYTYANPITAANTIPSSSNFGDNNLNGGSRVLKNTSGNSNMVSISAFIGVEYFFLPRMSIGGEYSLGYSHDWSGQENATSESWNGSKVVNTDAPQFPGQSGSSIATDRPATYGGLFLSFYF